MPRAQAKRGAWRDLYADIGALERTRVRVVDTLSLGVELFAEQVVVEASACARQRRVAARRTEGSALGAEAQFRHARGACRGPGLDYAGHGIGTVERALGAAHEFQPIHLVHGHNAE